MKKLLFILLFSALAAAPVAPAWASFAYDTDNSMHTMSPESMHTDAMTEDHECCDEDGTCINHDCQNGARCHTNFTGYIDSDTQQVCSTPQGVNVQNLKTAYKTHIATIAPPPKPYKN